MMSLSLEFIELRNEIFKSGLISQDGHYKRFDAARYDDIKHKIMNSRINELKEFITLKEKIFALYNKIITIPKCKTCSGLIKFNAQYKRYPPFCCRKCIQKDPDVIARQKRTYIENNSAVKAIEKRKKTSLIKYGVENPAQSAIIKQRIQETMMERYGVRNGLCRGDIRDKFEEQNLKLFGSKNRFTYGSKEFKELMVEKYGVTNYNKTQESKKSGTTKLNYTNNRYQDRLDEIYKLEQVVPLFSITDYNGILYPHLWKHIECGVTFSSNLDDGKIPSCPICWGSRSKPEAMVRKWISELQIEADYGVKSIIKPYELDTVIDAKKLAIEINGVYWHHEDRPLLPLLKKSNMLKEKMNYRLIHLWDHEIINQPEKIKSLLYAALDKIPNKIYARNCKLVNVSWAECSKFYDMNHIQNAGSPASINVALTYNNEIVCAMSFGKSRFSKTAKWELYRFCNKLNTVVVGGAQKLFKFGAPKQENIISYCDKRFFSGNIYKTLGFELSHESKPGYKWYSNKRILDRSKTKKHNLKELLGDFYDPQLSESENMKKAGYLKIIDCGQYVFLHGGI